jgi:hypothetical protein
MKTSAKSADTLPAVENALRTTWREVVQRVQASERALGAAERALHEATANADEVRQQIEAACPPLGLDAADIMRATDPTELPAIPSTQGPRIDYGGPRAQYEERVIDLLADGRLVAGEQIRTVHHGQEHFGRIESDGSISGPKIGSRPTLSAAARALVGGERNGWKFWTVLRDSRWLPVAELRNA